MSPEIAARRMLTPAPGRAGWTFLVLWALVVAGCGREMLEPLPRDSVVLVVGDSISAGFGVDGAQAWPVLVERESGWRVVNGGVSGDLSGDALARLPELLELHAPRLVLLEIGGNDMLRGVPEARIQANLEKMVAAARGRGAHVVVMAVPRPSLVGAALSSLQPAGLYAEVADRHKVSLLEDALSEVLSDSDLKLDPLHPNAAGHAALARKVVAGLRDTGLLR